MLLMQDPLPSWQRRGSPLYKGADKLVRVDPEVDATDGFFIALFARQPDGKKARKWQLQGSAAAQDGTADVVTMQKARKKHKGKASTG